MLSRLAIHDHNKFSIRIISLLNITIILGVWSSICLALFSNEVVILLYGNEFQTTAKIILTQCWYTLLFAILSIIGTVLSALDKQKLLSILSIISTLISVPILFFGSKNNAIGLSVSFVIAACINITYHWIILFKYLKYRIPIGYTLFLIFFIGTLIIFSYYYVFTIPVIIKLIIFLIMTLFVTLYIFKIEFKKLKIDFQ